ncbi:MAG: DNA topoisomerase, partial [Lachnospiraceae bacterium]|nr:DNA topoisomerase [Lachnospiraceae bacterium]
RATEAASLRFSLKQAEAILDMRLAKLIGLEINALKKEHEQTLKNIKDYREKLESRDAMSRQILSDLEEIKQKIGRERRTEIGNFKAAVFEEKPVEEADVVFVMDRFGYAKVIDMQTFERNKETIEGDDASFRYYFTVKNTGRVGIFTNTGQLHIIRVLSLPMSKLRDKGIPVDNLSNFDSSKEHFIYVGDMDRIINGRLIFVSKKGMMKFVDGQEFNVMSKRTVSCTTLAKDDELFDLRIYDEETDRQVLLQSNAGFFLRFSLEEIPEKKKNAIGVRGMKLSDDDSLDAVYYMNYADERTIEYHDRQMPLTHVKLTKRDGKGTKVR